MCGSCLVPMVIVCERIAVDVASLVWVAFLRLLDAVVTALAERLNVVCVEEQRCIALVRLDVVSDESAARCVSVAACLAREQIANERQPP